MDKYKISATNSGFVCLAKSSLNICIPSIFVGRIGAISMVSYTVSYGVSNISSNVGAKITTSESVVSFP